MREVTFLKRNAEKWKKIETLISEGKDANPDILADLFIQLTDDLSYSKTFYPGSKTLNYLNSIAAKVHQSIYRNKKEDKKNILKFWTSELPQLFYKHRKILLIAFIIFIVSILIGIISTAHDDKFVRIILGDTYVNMTKENIQKGDPMAVYKKMNGVDMFLGITFNNIMVSFYAFIMGIALAFGTGYILFSNGVMLGSFEYFFYQHNVLTQSLLTVWIHGVLEISAIVIAGGAGLLLGQSILMPETYSRRQSFMDAAKDGIKIIIGLIPIFIVAGFFESFVTRHTEMPLWVSLIIILSSICFIVWYVIILPYKNSKEARHGA